VNESNNLHARWVALSLAASEDAPDVVHTPALRGGVRGLDSGMRVSGSGVRVEGWG